MFAFYKAKYKCFDPVSYAKCLIDDTKYDDFKIRYNINTKGSQELTTGKLKVVSSYVDVEYACNLGRQKFDE